MSHALPWGTDQTMEVKIPQGWKLVVEHKGVRRPAIEDFPAAVTRVLAEPTDGTSLADVARDSQRVAIVVDDVGRPTPGHVMAPRVLQALLDAGLHEEQITVVFAVGNFGLQVLKDYHVMVFSPRRVEETNGVFDEFLYDDQEKMFKKAEALLHKSAPEACMIAQGGVSFPVVQE